MAALLIHNRQPSENHLQKLLKKELKHSQTLTRLCRTDKLTKMVSEKRDLLISGNWIKTRLMKNTPFPQFRQCCRIWARPVFHNTGLEDGFSTNRARRARQGENGIFRQQRKIRVLVLKNATSIFQRAIDVILRERISQSCYAYVDDVIIFSETKEGHIKDIDWVLKSLHDAGMRVSQEVFKFFIKKRGVFGIHRIQKRNKDLTWKGASDLKFPSPTHAFWP